MWVIKTTDGFDGWFSTLSDIDRACRSGIHSLPGKIREEGLLP
ncbi:hypothetical protein [Pectobacterium sp. IFB5596]|nr:hypothetical protein [Pectobacterium sp. IFB5596]